MIQKKKGREEECKGSEKGRKGGRGGVVEEGEAEVVPVDNIRCASPSAGVTAAILHYQKYVGRKSDRARGGAREANMGLSVIGIRVCVRAHGKTRQGGHNIKV